MSKRTMTLNLTDPEMAALEKLSDSRDMSKTAVIRQALRMYQLIDARLSSGEKLYFEDVLTKEKKEVVVL
jgi:predicted transcriptional regulator